MSDFDEMWYGDNFIGHVWL